MFKSQTGKQAQFYHTWNC